MAVKTAPLLLVGLLAGCAVAGAGPDRAAPPAVDHSFIKEAPPHWLRAMAVTRDISASDSCSELREVVARLPMSPASSSAARYNDMLVPLYFSTVSLRERSLGC
jgi:hypothetical protein